MALTDKLSQIKSKFKVPALTYSYPSTDYPPAMGDTPDFGLNIGFDPGAPPPDPMELVNQAPEAPQGPGGMLGNTGFQPLTVPGKLAVLKDALTRQAQLVQPVASKPKDLNTSEALIPLGIGLLAKLLGAHDQAVTGAVGNAWQGFRGQHLQEAQRQDLQDQAQFQSQSKQAGVDTDLAKLEYQAEQGDISAQRELAGKEHLLDKGAANDIALQKLRNEGDPDYLIAQLEGKLSRGEITNEQFKTAVIPLMRKDPYALAALQGTQAALNTEKTKDIQETRAARVEVLKQQANKLLTGQGLDDARANLLIKEYDNFDDTQAIKLALLKVQIESLGLTVQGKQFDNSPEKNQYEILKSDYARSDTAIKGYRKLAKEASDALNDIVKSALLSPEEKTRLQSQLETNTNKANEEQKHLDQIDSQMKALSDRLRSSPSRPGGRTPLPGDIPKSGYAPVDPTGKGFERVKSVADALDQLGL